MLLSYDFNKKINVYRRNQLLSNSAFVDIYNEPVYGNVTTNWQLVAASLPVNFDEENQPLSYNEAGERLASNYTIFAPMSSSITEEDRIMNLYNIGSESMYVVTSVTGSTDGFGLVDHLEVVVRTP